MYTQSSFIYSQCELSNAKRSRPVGEVMSTQYHASRSVTLAISVVCWAVLLSVLCVLPKPTLADRAQRSWQFSPAIGVGLLHFDYTEFSDEGVQLNHERDELPGVNVQLLANRDDWFLLARLDYFEGSVRYDGHSLQGVQVHTRTDTKLRDFSLRIGRRLATFPQSVTVEPYLGVGQQRWDRAIRSTPTVAGLSEIYRWEYALVGMSARFRPTNKMQWAVDLRVHRTVDPRLDIDFGGLFDNTSVKAQQRNGYRLSVSWQYQLQQNIGMEIVPYYEWWELGRGQVAPLRRDGQVVGSVFEPDSESQRVGLDLKIAF
jgi:hypothetical protein